MAIIATPVECSHHGKFMRIRSVFNMAKVNKHIIERTKWSFCLFSSSGHTVGVYVTYFGEHLSTVLLYHNNFPVATRYICCQLFFLWNENIKFSFFLFRYHFESNKERFLPTLTFSGGRVDVSVLWQNSVEQLPAITDVSIKCTTKISITFQYLSFSDWKNLKKHQKVYIFCYHFIISLIFYFIFGSND